MKKTLTLILLVVMCASVALLTTGCEHEHVYAEAWAYDDTHHWHVCTAEDGCESNQGYTTHRWATAVQTKAATCTEKGEQTLTCECGQTKVEEVALAAHTLAEDGVYCTTCEMFYVSTVEQLVAVVANNNDAVVQLAEGTYQLTEKVTIASSGITIIGNGTTIIDTDVLTESTDDTGRTASTAVDVTAANVTFKNITFKADVLEFGSMVRAIGENVTFEKCTFSMLSWEDPNTSYDKLNGILLWNNDSATIKDCTFDGGFRGIYVNGKDVDTDTDTDKLVIENCSFKGAYALHVGGNTNVVATNCDFNAATTLYNGSGTFTNCRFNDDTYRLFVYTYYSTPITFEQCTFGAEFVFAVRQSNNAVNVVVNNASYKEENKTFVNYSYWGDVTNGTLTAYTVTENGTAQTVSK